MSKVVKTGIAFRKDILSKLERYMRAVGLKNRSKIVSEALELYLAERSLSINMGEVGGAILIYYNHKAVEDLTELQHKYINLIVSSTHMHIDQDNCIEVILVKGNVKNVKKLVIELENIREMKALRYNLFQIN